MSALTPPHSLKSKPLTHTYSFVRSDRRKADYMIQRPPPSSQLMLGGGRHLETAEGVLLNDTSISPAVASYLRTAISGYFADEYGYPEDEDRNKASSSLKPSAKQDPLELRESFLERFRNLTVSAGHDAWDAAEGAGMYSQLAASQEFHQHHRSAPNSSESRRTQRAKECNAEYEWTGVMGFSRDEKPFVGRVPAVSALHARRLHISPLPDTRGLWVIAGFEGHGMAFTTGSSKALAEMIKRDDEGGHWDQLTQDVQADWFPRGFMSTPERMGLGGEDLASEEPEVVRLDGAHGEPPFESQDNFDGEMKTERKEWKEKEAADEWVVVESYEDEADEAIQPAAATTKTGS